MEASQACVIRQNHEKTKRSTNGLYLICPKFYKYYNTHRQS